MTNLFLFLILIKQEIDEYINQAKEKGYTAVLQLGTKGFNYATTAIMQTAIKVSFDHSFSKGHGKNSV